VAIVRGELRRPPARANAQPARTCAACCITGTAARRTSGCSDPGDRGCTRPSAQNRVRRTNAAAPVSEARPRPRTHRRAPARARRPRSFSAIWQRAVESARRPLFLPCEHERGSTLLPFPFRSRSRLRSRLAHTKCTRARTLARTHPLVKTRAGAAARTGRRGRATDLVSAAALRWSRARRAPPGRHRGQAKSVRTHPRLAFPWDRGAHVHGLWPRGPSF